MLKSLALSLIFTFSFITSANFATANELIRDSKAPTCHEALKECRYTVQNLTSARQLITRVSAVMFPDAPLDPREGFMTPVTYKELVFWFESAELRQRFIALVPRFDAYEDFIPSALILFETEIYAISNEGITNLEASLGLSSTAPTSTPTGTGIDLGFAINYGVASLNLSVSLTAVRSRGQATKLTTVKQIVPNYADLNFSHITNVYIAPTPGQFEKQEAGLRVSGGMSISNESRNQVVVHDFNLYYGIEVPPLLTTGTSRVSALSYGTPELVLEKDMNYLLVSSNGFETSRVAGLGLPSSFRSTVRNAKLLIITRAKAFSYDEFLEEVRQLRRFNTVTQFSQEQIAAFPDSPVSEKALLSSISASAKTTLDGERILTLKLQKELARIANFNKVYDIKISAKGFKQRVVRKTDQLMLQGIVIDKLPEELLRSPVIKFTIKFRALGRKFGSNKTVKLYFNPETNEFYQ